MSNLHEMQHEELVKWQDRALAAEAANREKNGVLFADDERLKSACDRVGIPFMGSDTADHLAEEILSLRASVGGEKWIEIKEGCEMPLPAPPTKDKE